MDRRGFRTRLAELLADIDPEVLAYDAGDFQVVRNLYETLEYFAEERELINTALALHLARGLHDGVFRKHQVTYRGEKVRAPYLIHPLTVCRLLGNLEPAVTHEELDILLAAAMCHDMIEDLPFPEHGRELYTRFHLDPRVYETVRKVSKRKDFTPEEEQHYFDEIQADRLALLVKLSDRGNNVEDLYNMRLSKVHEYAEETRSRFYPMADYGKEHYPELSHSIRVLEEKIQTLVDAAVTLTDRYDQRIHALEERRDALQGENDRLRARVLQLRQEKEGGTPL